MSSGIAGSYGSFSLSIFRHYNFIEVELMTFLTAVNDSSFFLHISASTVISILFDKSHSHLYEIISHYCFVFHFSDNK